MRRAWHSLRDGTGFDVALVLLALAYLFVFAALPIAYTVVMPLQKVDMFTLGTLRRPFAGLSNYLRVFHKPEARLVAENTLIFVVLSVVFQLLIGFALAAFFQQRFPFAGTLRGLFLAGWVMPALGSSARSGSGCWPATSASSTTCCRQAASSTTTSSRYPTRTSPCMRS